MTRDESRYLFVNTKGSGLNYCATIEAYESGAPSGKLEILERAAGELRGECRATDGILASGQRRSCIFETGAVRERKPIPG